MHIGVPAIRPRNGKLVLLFEDSRGESSNLKDDLPEQPPPQAEPRPNRPPK